MNDSDKPFTKHDGSKWRLSLLPAKGLAEVCRAAEHGARLYPPGNWRRCAEPERYLDAAIRHLVEASDTRTLERLRGRRLGAGDGWDDDDSGLNHLAHAALNCLFVIEMVHDSLGIPFGTLTTRPKGAHDKEDEET